MNDYRESKLKTADGTEYTLCITNAVMYKVQKQLGLKGFVEMEQRLAEGDMELILSLMCFACPDLDTVEEAAEVDAPMSAILKAIEESWLKSAMGPDPKKKSAGKKK